MFLDIFQVSAPEILELVELVNPYRNNSKTNY